MGGGGEDVTAGSWGKVAGTMALLLRIHGCGGGWVGALGSGGCSEAKSPAPNPT